MFALQKQVKEKSETIILTIEASYGSPKGNDGEIQSLTVFANLSEASPI